MGVCVSRGEYLELKEENEKLRQENIRLNSQIINTNDEIIQTDFYDIVIYIESINDIIKGWNVEFHPRVVEKYKEFTEDKVIKIGVIGNSNKGKSFILSKLSKFDLPCGTSIKTKGLSIKFPELEKYPNKKIALLDSAGLETPVLLEKNATENQNEVYSNENINKNLQKKFLLFKEESRDKIITEYFLQNYIIHNSDILIVVVGNLSYSEQKLLNKIKSEFLRAKNKTLYVIHNLMTFTTVKQVETYIQETLLKSATFNLEKQIIPNEGKEPILCFYEKKSNPQIKHLIFANQGSEAGNKYNNNTLEYLEKAYITITDLEPFDVLKTVKERFKIISKEILEKNEGKKNYGYQNDIKKIEDSIIFDDSNSNVIKLIKPETIKLKKCLIDELGFQNLKSNGYEPSYNCYRNGNKIIVRVEAPGESSLRTEFLRNEGYTFIRIIGNKQRDNEPSKIESNIYNTRESGEFLLDIPLKYEDFWLKYKEPLILNKNGIFTIIFDLETCHNN